MLGRTRLVLFRCRRSNRLLVLVALGNIRNLTNRRLILYLCLFGIGRRCVRWTPAASTLMLTRGLIVLMKLWIRLFKLLMLLRAMILACKLNVVLKRRMLIVLTWCAI